MRTRCRHMSGKTVDYRQNSDLTIGINLMCLEPL